MTTRRILLVDDNPHDLELALNALGDNKDGVHQEVQVAGSGQEALALLRAAQESKEGGGGVLPDLVLLDLNMTHMDGIAVLDVIRADEQLRDIPVVMLTTSGEDRDIQASYAHGASAYVVKPIDFTQFRDAMQTIQAFWTNLNRRPHLH